MKAKFPSENGKVVSMPNGREKIEAIRADIQEELQALYELAEHPEEFQISADSPEIRREYESELKALEARGKADNAEVLRSHPEEAMQYLAKKHSETIYAEYKHIVGLIKGADYEEAFKVLMLRETLMKTYKKINEEEKDKTIVKKRDLSKSIAGMMLLNKTVLDTIYNNLEDYDNFANLYYAGVAIYNKNIAERSTITFDGVETQGKGRWIKFEGKTSNEAEYLENAQKLAALVADTPWCTRELAATQLEEGDFYVFVDEEGKPHIAVKMNGKEIDEVRGIKGGNEQRVEEEYTDVELSFLENNQEVEGGKEWLEGERWNQRLIDLRKKIERGEFEVSDVEELNELLFGEDKTYSAHDGTENSNKRELIQSLNLVKDKIAEYYGCTEEEICVGNIYFYQTDYEAVPFVAIYGDVFFGSSQIIDLGKLQNIGGNADFSYSKVTDLGQLRNIGGKADFRDSQVVDLGKLQTIGGDAIFGSTPEDAEFEDYDEREYSQITRLGNLRRIGGNAYFAYSKVTDLGQLSRIGGDADFCYSQVVNLGQLESIGGNALFGAIPTDDWSAPERDNDERAYSQITSLGNLQRIGGSACFAYSKVTDLGKLESIGHDASFYDSEITDLGNLQSIGMSVDFRHTKIKSLGQLKSIGQDASFYDSEITDLSNLQSIGRSVDFRHTKIISLGQIQNIGGKIIDNEHHLKEQYEEILAKRGNAVERSLIEGEMFSEERTGDLQEALGEMNPEERKGGTIQIEEVQE